MLSGVISGTLIALSFAVGCDPGGGYAGNGSDAGEGGHGAVGGTGLGGGMGLGGGTGGTSVISDGGTGGDCAPTNSCTPEIVCGNSVLEDSAEECDDGNVQSSDGCSRECQVEAGWVCPITGAACQAATCGDGILAGLELCDDGNMAGGDGCGEDCGFEAGFDCVSPGELCVPTVCGNALREGTEPCDDGNFDMGDGCTPLCELEPDCSQGACSSHCGDGIKFSDEPCDDGNVRDGDGCSSLCEIEAGFSCEEISTAPEEALTLPIVYRDFQGGPLRTSCGTSTSIQACMDTPGCHPDFEQFKGCNGEELGIVEYWLDADGKPRHVPGSRPETVNGDAGILIDYFDLWYRDAPDYNKTLLGELTFVDLEPDPQRSVYRYENESFFPIDGQGWGNTPGQVHNYHFTSEVRTWFEYRGGEQLDFFGDDDVFVFVNKRLAVDLGGVHGQLTGSLILDQTHGTGLVCDHLAECSTRRAVDFGLELGKIYEIVVLQAERHTAGSHYQLTLSNFHGTRSECGPVCGDGVVTRNEACDDGVNDGRYGTCNTDCSRAPFCGDGVLHEPQEQCDDGNHRNGDGCSASCNKENVK